MSKLIYAVDDEIHIRELLEYNIKNAGYNVKTFSCYEELMDGLSKKECDLFILDVMLETIQGTEICYRLRQDEKYKNIPIIMLTAKSNEFDKVIGLDSGADDYITKPFSINELTARIRAVLRRFERLEKTNLKEFDLEINLGSREVRKNGELLNFTLKEFEVLKMLMSNKNKVYTRDELLNNIWGYEYYGDTRTVDVHVRQIRKQLKDTDEKYIKTVRGIGYKFSSGE